MEFLKWGQKQVRQFALNLTDTEVLVEEATNSDPWGPHGKDMAKISDAAMDSEKYREIMTVIARRLTDTPENWRHIYKALLLLEYMAKHGPMKVAKDILSNTSLLIQLQSFDYKDEMGRDHGLNVRNRSKELLALVSDADRLAEARESAKLNRGKYTGSSAEDMKFRMSTGSFTQTLPKRVVYEDKTDHDDDPFEATRKRIEAIKAEKEAPMKVKVPQQKETKKLSQVKVNPEIAKTFMKPNQLTTKPATETEPVATESVSFQPASDAMDLLGDLTDDHVSTHSAPARTEDAHAFDGFDALTDPSVPPVRDDWAAFQESPVQPPVTSHHIQSQAPPLHQELSLSALLNQESMHHAPVDGSMSVARPTAVSGDPFADLCLSTQPKPGIPMGRPASMPQFSSTVPSQEMPQWHPPSTVQQTSVPSNGFQSSTRLRQPGAPMNPNAVQPPRAAPKNDPFANLGF